MAYGNYIAVFQFFGNKLGGNYIVVFNHGGIIFVSWDEFYGFFHFYLVVGGAERDEDIASRANFGYCFGLYRLDCFTVYLKDYERINIHKKCSNAAIEQRKMQRLHDVHGGLSSCGFYDERETSPYSTKR